MIELLNMTDISNSVFSVKNLLIGIPFFILSLFIIKNVSSYKYSIIGFMWGCIVVPFSGGFFELLNSYTNLTIFIVLLLITYTLYKLKLHLYKILIYPIFILIVLVLILYAHFIFPIIFQKTQSTLEFYLFSAFIYLALYLIIGVFIDKTKRI